MGKYFSDVVDKAIEDLYYCCDNDRAKAAAEALFQAAKEGDGDACYFLSRCFSGSCYSWEYHPFEENEAAAYLPTGLRRCRCRDVRRTGRRFQRGW